MSCYMLYVWISSQVFRPRLAFRSSPQSGPTTGLSFDGQVVLFLSAPPARQHERTTNNTVLSAVATREERINKIGEGIEKAMTSS